MKLICMEKTFCDFCGNEIKLGEKCSIEFREPRTEVNMGNFEVFRAFDTCKDCFQKKRLAMGIK